VADAQVWIQRSPVCIHAQAVVRLVLVRERRDERCHESIRARLDHDRQPSGPRPPQSCRETSSRAMVKLAHA
jgi:hypothetical protein